MSSQLQMLDLTGQPIGFQGLITFNQFVKFNPAMRNQSANIWLFNESGAGLDVVFQQSGNAHYLPAGAWGYYPLAPNDGQVQVTVTYLLPNPPVSQLNAIYYAPGEPLPQSFTLGNSPIGIGGTVNTSSVQTLSNESSPPTPLLVVDIGNTTIPQLLTIYNDGSFLWEVLVAGVAHQLLSGSVANLLQIGMAGDTSSVLGQLSVAQLLTALAGLNVTGVTNLDGGATTTDGAGNITLSNAKILKGKSSGGVAQAMLFQSAANNTDLQAGTNGFIEFLDNGGTRQLHADLTNNLSFVLDNTNLAFKNGNTIGRVSSFSGTGSGTYNHNAGAAPDIVIPIVSVSGSATQGFDSLTSTQVHVTLGASLAFKAWCFKS